MAAIVPESHHDLLNSAIHVVMGTIMPDNTPHSVVMWFKWDGEHVLISTTKARKKTANLEHIAKTTLMFVDPESMYRYLEIRGDVEIIEEGGYELIDELAMKYRGVAAYYGGITSADRKAVEERIILKVTPYRVIAH